MQPLWKQYWGASKIKNRTAIWFRNFTLEYLSEGNKNTNLKTQCSLQQYLFSWQVVSDSLQPHGLQHARFLCPSLPPGVCYNPCPLSRWYYLIISPSAALFSFCLQSFPSWGSFPKSQLFASGVRSIGAPTSVIPMNIQGWFPLGLTGLISLLFKGLSRVFSNTMVQKHQFFHVQPSLWSNSHIRI